MKHRLGFLVLSLFLAGAVTAGADQLFLGTGPADLNVFSKATLDARQVVPNVDALANAARTLEFRLFDGNAYSARLTDFENRGPGDVTWRGYLAGDYRVVLTLKQGFVAGLIYSPDGLYEVSTLRDGGQGLARIDQELYEPCAVDGRRSEGHTHRGPRPDWFGPSLLTDIDLLGVYTDLARQGAGGAGQIAATIQAAIDNANTGFMDSNMDTRFTLVATAEVPWVENGNGSSALNWVRSDPDVNKLRNEVRADMVGMTIENWGSFCGVAYVMRTPSHTFAPSAVQVTRRSCAVGNLTYAHEHGHNMGFEHDPANGAPPGNASHPFAFGHYVNGSYRTIMSYSNQCTQGCTRVAHWSNPNVTQAGEPTGITGQRENWMAGILNDDYTQLFRNGAVELSVSGSCPGQVNLNVTKASPNSEVIALVGDPGTFQPKQTSCAGTIVGLGEPFTRLGSLVTDANGNASKSVNLGAGDCGRQIFAFDFPSCTDSAAVNVP